MKKFLAIFISTFALAGCSLTQPIPVKGEVVSCDPIKVLPIKGEALDCLDGSTGVAVDSIKGPALLNVWGTWCAPCRKELPHLAHYLAKHPKGAQVIGIAVEEKSPLAVKKFVETHGMTWPILYDAKGSTRGKFGMGVPVTWFIDAEGKVIYKKIGAFANYTEVESLAKEHFNLQ